MLERIIGKNIAYYVKQNRGLVVLSIILMALSSAFVVVPAFLIQPFVDEAMKFGTEPVVWKIPWVDIQSGFQRTERILIEGITPNRLLILLSGIAFLSYFLKSVALYFSQLAAVSFSNRAIKSLRVDLYNKFLSLPMSFYHKQKIGTLISRSTADLTVMQERIANIIIGLVQHPLTAIAFLGYLLLMNYQLTLIIFITVPIIVYLIRLFGRKVKKHSQRVQDAVAEVTSKYQETLLCLKIIQGFCRDEEESNKFREFANQLYKKVMRWNRWYLGLGPTMDSTVFLVFPVVIIIGKVYFQHTFGELMSMFFAFSQAYAPLKSLARVNNELRTLHGATSRVFEIMRTEPDLKEHSEARDMSRHKESIEFRKVGFSYEPGPAVLKDLNFKIRAGEMAAFVGSTGAGKSTILDLIPRFYDVSKGSILIDGVDIRDVTLPSLRKQIGVVSQDVLLFHDTIADNINYGLHQKDLADIEKASRAAYAHEFILAQPHGYHTIVGDRGSLLSGGQKQRIAIARAILTDPAILILDEAASALDAESEKRIQAALTEMKGKRTILVVTHRLSTIREADQVFVIEKGAIVESGEWDELMALNGRFKQLHDMQFRT